VRLSGLPECAGTSIEEPQLPGVLSDLPGLIELTLARGSLSVVTPPAGSSRIRESIDTAGSPAGKAVGRLTCLEGVWEKKRGERGPSCFPLAAEG
jgi:hypothetical protein